MNFHILFSFPQRRENSPLIYLVYLQDLFQLASRQIIFIFNQQQAALSHGFSHFKRQKQKTGTFTISEAAKARNESNDDQNFSHSHNPSPFFPLNKMENIWSVKWYKNKLAHVAKCFKKISRQYYWAWFKTWMIYKKTTECHPI